MSKGVKIALAVVGVLMLLCCCSGVAGYFVLQQTLSQTFGTDPTQAAKIGHEIVDYTMPAGYVEGFSMNLAGIKMVGITPQGQASSGTLLMLMEFPAYMTLSREQMEEQTTTVFARQSQRGKVQWQVMDTQKATIRGQSVTLTIGEGTDLKGNQLRQMLGTFASKNGMTMFMAAGSKSTWNEGLVMQFLASIR